MLSLFLLVALETSNAKDIRIVSFSPAVTETLFDLELGKYIVGTSEHSNYPPKAKKIPRIGGYTTPDIEKTVSLKPNFIVTEVAYKEKFFKTLGIETVVISSKKIEDFKKNILLLKQKFPKANQKKVLKKWNENLKKIPSKKTKLQAIIKISNKPIMLAGKDTLLYNILSMCGVENLFKHKGYKKISKETLLILSKKATLIEVADTLIEKKGVEVVNPDFLSRLTLRMSENLYKICLSLSN